MNRIDSKPYKIRGKIQHYDWGTKNENAYIPKFLEIEPEKDLAYAEYWIGVHPKAPSEVLIQNDWVSLKELLVKYPSEILGNRVSEKFNNRLPFLLKVLSINQALSIQAHPDKNLAKLLHDKNPKNYPDDNHKPEIAIAIDNLTAIVGLKKIEDLISTLNNYPEIQSLLTLDVTQLNLSLDENKSSRAIKDIYSQIMRAPDEKLVECIANLVSRIGQKNAVTESEKQFLVQYKNYGVDIGLISILLFNLVNLNKGEAIYTPAGIPHAYIKGNIIECMANSDNVVRAGLTPKFKDINTLLEMIETDSFKANVNKIFTNDSIIYKTGAEEFEVEELIFNKPKRKIVGNEIYILLIMEGELNISYSDNKSDKFKSGDVVLIPAILNEITIEAEDNVKVYKIKIP